VQNNRNLWSQKSLFFCFLIFGVSLVQQACVSQINVPVSEGDFSVPQRSQSHLVQQGETLYSIAWNLNKNYKQLAYFNDIPAPYVIYPGQVLRWGESAKKLASYRVKSNPKQKPKIKRPKKKGATPAAVTKRDGQRRAATISRPTGAIQWFWPYGGPVISRFSRAGVGNRGLDISGKAGDSVKAAANGEVVYSGSGLVGYGNLIIIKHNDIFLSAYAHNRRLFVKEGENVKAGQKIAEIGSSGTNLEKLHFEIRREGTPVDPLHLLPQRG